MRISEGRDCQGVSTASKDSSKVFYGLVLPPFKKNRNSDMMRRWELSTHLCNWTLSSMGECWDILKLFLHQFTSWIILYTPAQKWLGLPWVTFRHCLTGIHFWKFLQFYMTGISCQKSFISFHSFCAPSCRTIKLRLSFIVLAMWIKIDHIQASIMIVWCSRCECVMVLMVFSVLFWWDIATKGISW